MNKNNLYKSEAQKLQRVAVFSVGILDVELLLALLNLDMNFCAVNLVIWRVFYNECDLMLISGRTDFCADAMHGLLAAIITGKRCTAALKEKFGSISAFYRYLSIWLFAYFSAAVFGAIGAGCVAVPSTSCYVLDNTSHIYDFVSFIMLYMFQ